MSVLSTLVQKVFFRGIKTIPNAKWRDRAHALGDLRYFSLQRAGKSIACFEISPKQAEPVVAAGCDIVIFSHPISKKAKFFVSDSQRAALYLERGVRVISFDYNGFGESDSIDLNYWRDAKLVIEHVKAQFPGCKICLHGLSFGAFHIIRAIEYLPLGSKVILENVNKSLYSYWQKWPITRWAVKLLEVLPVQAIADMNVKDVCARLDRKDLRVDFIACQQDKMTTPEEMQELFGTLIVPNKRFTLFDGADHLNALSVNFSLYESVLFE